MIATFASSAQSISGEQLATKLLSKAQILYDCINFLADKNRSNEVKQHYMTQALDLFVNKGEPFKIDSIITEGSYIILKSDFSKKPVKRKMKDFLQGIIDLRYTPIDVTSINIPALPTVINPTEFVKAGENIYKYNALITREYAGTIDGVPVYKEITPYIYTLYLGINNTANGKEYFVYLNDIEVNEAK